MYRLKELFYEFKVRKYSIDKGSNNCNTVRVGALLTRFRVCNITAN